MFCKEMLVSSRKIFSHRNIIHSVRLSFSKNISLACQREIHYSATRINSTANQEQTFVRYRRLLKVIQRYVATSSIQRTTEVDRTRLTSHSDFTIEKAHSQGILATKDDNRSDPDIPEETVKQVTPSENPPHGDAVKLFNSPKGTLHNIFQQVTCETKNIAFKATPSYRLVLDHKKQMWLCTYNISWPTEMKFMAKDSKKSVASTKAALQVLSWLLKEKKITKEGVPILYDENEVKILTKKSYPIVSLDHKTIDKMQRIVGVYEKEISPRISRSQSTGDKNEDDAEDIFYEELEGESFKQRTKYLGYEKYMAKEKVKLPISDFKEKIIDQVNSHQVVIIKGEPGCGKSTRVPQYILEAWAKDASFGKPGKIAVTQPRRIAAISLSQRVAAEREELVGHIVGYQVRLNSNFRQSTGRILYCTTGILLRHLQTNSNLSDFTHVILDEAHERDVNTDLLMNLLRSAIKKNPNLKLIVMSATIDTGVFSEYFGGAPVLDIPGFTYPVEQHFLESLENVDVQKTLKMCDGEVATVVHEDVVQVLQHIHKSKPEGAILCFLPGWEDISKIRKLIPERSDLVVHCLHSRLQDSEQWKIFSRPPPGVRKIILATNIAETSVTVDDVVYVVDTGVHKEQRFDVVKGIKCIDNHWISKASATQRKGRAGRCCPGESFHLYTRAKYDAFAEYSLPEILRTSLSKIVLDCKVVSSDANALEFMGQLPTPPAEAAVAGAVRHLKDLELLDGSEKLTPLGRTLSDFQLEPELAKAMVDAVVFKCVSPVVDVVTLFSAETELFVSGLLNKEAARAIKRQFCRSSDHLAMMRLFEKFLEIADEDNSREVERFCQDACLVPHKMRTLEKLRKIHFDYLHNGLQQALPLSDDYSDNDELVKAMLFSGGGNLLTYRTWDIVKRRLKKDATVLLTRNNHKATITPESVNFKKTKFPTNHLLYINETRSDVRRTTLVRECSLLPDVSVLLFSNREMKIKTVADDENQLELVFEGTNIKFLCDKRQAADIVRCREALRSSYQYFIKQLTDGGESSDEIISSWDSILKLLSDILIKNRVKE
ncbi:ATP-dependent RNA helicase DHX30 [Leptinotarsa decemlineata]|uniref:ATP-dependent RNA helicase DHX30 n=1 Tax=Leptinotarsa decemlineata TaxID=7539 RepID=UPI003D30575D